MTVVVSGSDLRIVDVVRVARDGEPVELAPDVVPRMAAARAIVDEEFERGDLIYGLSTGVGVLKRARVNADEIAAAGARLLETHRVGQGPPATRDIARACALALVNGLAQGTSGVRPQVPERLIERINEDRLPELPMLGSIGQADLALLSELAAAIFQDFLPAPGEVLALINNNAFSAAAAALAVHDADRLLDAMEVAGALSLEAQRTSTSCTRRSWPRDRIRASAAARGGSGAC